ncbi:MAG: glycoside hydrolase family 3 N-terminal domain-containing protein [Treponema sp.]
MRHKVTLFLIFSFFLSSLFASDFDVSSMTLEEKAYQVMMVNVPSGNQVSQFIKKEFLQGTPGAILLFKQNLASSPEDTQRYTSLILSSFKEVSIDNNFSYIPPFIAVDNEGGRVFRTLALTTILPSAKDMATKMTTKEVEEASYFLAMQMKLLGINFNLAPILECGSKENEEVLGDRTFSHSHSIVVDFSNAFIRGMNRAGVLCSIKHFPGNGNVDPHGNASSIVCTEEEFEANYLLPFKKVIKEGHEGIAMLLSHVEFSLVDDKPFCLSKVGIKEVVREKLKFPSLVLTDDIAMKALKMRGSSADNAVLALEAGADMVMCSERHVAKIISSIVDKAGKDGKFLKRLDEACYNVLKAKKMMLNLDSRMFDRELFYSLKKQGDDVVEKYLR